MLQSNLPPSPGHHVVDLSCQRAPRWGQALNPSIAHFLQGQRMLSIDCSGTGFQTTTGIGRLPHVIDPSTLRLHIGMALARAARRAPEQTMDAVLRCELGDGCALTIWGRMSPEAPAKEEISTGNIVCAMVPALFSLMFWEVSRPPVGALPVLLTELKEKQDRIRKLEMQVSLSMSTQ